MKPEPPPVRVRPARQTEPLEDAAFARWKIPNPAEFRVWIAAERERCEPRLSQAELARISNVARSTVARIEAGKVQATLLVAWRLAFVVYAVKHGIIDPRRRRIISSWNFVRR